MRREIVISICVLYAAGVEAIILGKVVASPRSRMGGCGVVSTPLQGIFGRLFISKASSMSIPLLRICLAFRGNQVGTFFTFSPMSDLFIEHCEKDVSSASVI